MNVSVVISHGVRIKYVILGKVDVKFFQTQINNIILRRGVGFPVGTGQLWKRRVFLLPQ